MAFLTVGKTDLAIGRNGDLLIDNRNDMRIASGMNFIRQEILRGMHAFDTSLILGRVTYERSVEIFRQHIKTYCQMKGILQPNEIRVDAKRMENNYQGLMVTVSVQTDVDGEYTELIPDYFISTQDGQNIYGEPGSKDTLARTNNRLELVVDPVIVDKRNLGANNTETMLIELCTEPVVENMIEYDNYEEYIGTRGGPNVNREKRRVNRHPILGIENETDYRNDPVGYMEENGYTIDSEGRVLFDGVLIDMDYDTSMVYPELLGKISIFDNINMFTKSVYACTIHPTVEGFYRISDYVNTGDAGTIISMHITMSGDKTVGKSVYELNIDESSNRIYIPSSIIGDDTELFVLFAMTGTSHSTTNRCLRLLYDTDEHILPLKRNAGIYKAIMSEVLSEGEYVLVYYTYNFSRSA